MSDTPHDQVHERQLAVLHELNELLNVVHLGIMEMEVAICLPSFPLLPKKGYLLCHQHEQKYQSSIVFIQSTLWTKKVEMNCLLIFFVSPLLVVITPFSWETEH
jgi:hypothetical protein